MTSLSHLHSHTRHTLYRSVYSSDSEFYRLCEALDERGEREMALKQQLKARFALSDPVHTYQETGSFGVHFASCSIVLHFRIKNL